MRDVELRGKYLTDDSVRTSGFCSSRWYREILETDDEGVTVKLFDAAYAEPERLSYREVDGLIICYGLWTRVGMVDFVRADDPAVHHIRLAYQYPEIAGKRLYELEEELRERSKR